MKTDEVANNFNILGSGDFNTKNELAESKKVKLMYTSEFLKSFDRAARQPSSFSEDFDADKKLRAGKDFVEGKDNQIQQLRYLVLKLKDLIMEDSADEISIKRMKDILSENEEGRQLLFPVTEKKKPLKETPKVPPLKIPDGEFAFEPAIVSPISGTQISPTSISPTSSIPIAYSSLISPTTSSLLSSAPSTPSPAPITAASVPKQVSLKSPGRGPTTKPKATVISPPTSNKNLMKRSPSMPVINNERQKQEAAAQAQLKLQKKTKSTEDASVDKKKGVDDKKQKEPISPRKGIKKSVSMSSICTEATLKCTSLEEIVGQIYPLTKYQAGCRFLQKKLEEQPDPQHVTLVFTEVFEHLIELMTDPYGQYLVPKLMKYCDKQQRQAIVTKIAPKIVTFACHTYGIHGVQKILEFLTDEQVDTFIEAIKPNAIHLAKDSKGNYLIQSFLKQFPSERNQFIYDAITDNCVEVATHKVGCTLINRCIDYANEKQMLQMVTKIGSNCLSLVQDQFGNYVVQHLLSTKVQFAPKIIEGLLGHIPELSVQKFSSNVIEKCLQVASQEHYSAVIQEITNANLLELLQDRYANFVIQTALDVADDQQHAKLVKMILPYIHQIKTPYVMHIQKKILQV